MNKSCQLYEHLTFMHNGFMVTLGYPSISGEALLDLWSIVALQVVALVGGMLTGAIALLVGGVGGIRALAKRLDIVENAHDDLSIRITKEVKARAGALGGARKAVSDADVLAEAHEHTRVAPASASAERPSPVTFRKGR